MLRKLIPVYALAAALACAPALCLGADAVEEPALVKPIGDVVRWIGREGGSGLSLHKQNYLLLPTWGNRAESSSDAEMKFQLSLKYKIPSSNLYIAYTQKSFWRILDADDSRPFRESNYNPELFYRFDPGRVPWIPWKPFGLAVGFEHESNGAREPTSRSWNRVYLTPSLEFDRFSASLKLWVRLSEEVKRYPSDPKGDENPDIEEFLGHGELRLGYRFESDQELNLMGRHNFSTGKGALRADYSIPFTETSTALYFQLWTGYGESLIDYDRYLTRYGVGIRLKI